MNIEQVEEVVWYVLGAFEDIIAYDGVSFLDRYCMMNYYTGENNQPIKEHFEKTIKQVLNEYQYLNPELDIPISLVFDLHGFDVHDFIIKQARDYFYYIAEKK